MAAVIVVALALVILRPFPGDSHFGLRMSLFIPPFLSTLDVLWYLRTRCQRSRRQDSVVAPSPAGEGDGWAARIRTGSLDHPQPRTASAMLGT